MGLAYGPGACLPAHLDAIRQRTSAPRVFRMGWRDFIRGQTGEDNWVARGADGGADFGTRYCNPSTVQLVKSSDSVTSHTGAGSISPPISAMV